jgi:hypothetical protein
LLHWRDKHAPGKEVWVSEFGWDCSTKKPDPKGEWAKWVGSTDEDQARWLVRSFLIFARMGLDRAYVYFFNDDDKPQLHACSGLTRNFQPKPSYHSIAWMLKHLADVRFTKVIQESMDNGYVYQLDGEKPGTRLLAAWHPTGDGPAWEVPAGLGKIRRVERMPLAPGAAAEVQAVDRKIPMGVDPVFVWLE